VAHVRESVVRGRRRTIFVVELQGVG